MSQLPLDTSCSAEYADGYILDETDQQDRSVFVDGKNTFYDILERLPETEHGPMIRFSVFYKNQRYDVDWIGLPTNARPIRFRHGFSQVFPDSTIINGWSGVQFGYQYTDEVTGRNVKEVREL